MKKLNEPLTERQKDIEIKWMIWHFRNAGIISAIAVFLFDIFDYFFKWKVLGVNIFDRNVDSWDLFITISIIILGLIYHKKRHKIMKWIKTAVESDTNVKEKDREKRKRFLKHLAK